MKYTYIKATISIFAAIALISCSSNDDSFTGDATLSLSTEVSTRSILIDNQFNSWDRIGVFAVNSSGSSYSSNSYNMEAYLTSDKKWTILNNAVVHLTNDNATIYAYYPYKAGSSLENVLVDISTTWDHSQTDYLYGTNTNTVNINNAEAKIKFKYALALVTFNIKCNNSSEGIILDGVFLENSGNGTAIADSGYMNVKTGIISPVIKNKACVYTTVDKTLNNSSVNLEVIPTTVNNNVNLVLIINHRRFVVPLPNVNFERGNKYTYPVTIEVNDFNSYNLSIGQPTISDWVSETLGSTEISSNNKE